MTLNITHIVDADVGLGRGLHEGRGGSEALAEGLPLRHADHPLLLQVALVAHHHYRGQLPRPVNILGTNTDTRRRMMVEEHTLMLFNSS